ncbi:MAG: hypothetical protein ACR2KJ_17570 [Jatrophihabitans sp.]
MIQDPTSKNWYIFFNRHVPGADGRIQVPSTANFRMFCGWLRWNNGKPTMVSSKHPKTVVAAN